MRWLLAVLVALAIPATAAASMDCQRATHAERHMALQILKPTTGDRVAIPSCWRVDGGRRVTVYAFFTVLDGYPRVWVHWTDTLRVRGHKLVVTAGDLHADGLPPF